jgi:hypothetical protein
MDAACDGAAKVVAGSAYWSYDRDDGYGVLASDGSEKPALLDVLVRPFPERVAGDLVSYGYESSTKTLTFRVRPKGDGATIVSAPLRVYPGGADVACGNCRVESSPGRLTLTSLSGSESTIRIGPKGTFQKHQR